MFYIFSCFCLFFTVFMAESKAARQGQRKGKNVPIGDAPPIPLSSGSASIPSIGSGAATVASNVQGKQIVDPKYTLWKYATKRKGQQKREEEDNVHGNAIFVMAISLAHISV